MTRPSLASALLVLCIGWCALAPYAAHAAPALRQDKPSTDLGTNSASKGPPNFIVIVGEGCGWSGTSVAMDEAHGDACAAEALTPNLAKLAAEGQRASQFYASSPRCTPSRASLFTGVSPAVLRMTYVNEGGSERRGAEAEAPPTTKLIAPNPSMELPADVKTIAQWLKPVGYASAHFGKWHVGRSAPSKVGFDIDDGANTNSGPGRNAQPNPEEGISITDRGIAFMEAQVKAKKPFYLHMSHYGGGTEEEVTPESMELVSKLQGERARSSRGKELYLKGVVADVDKQIGRVLAKLEELGIAGNTYVMFTTDHGTQGHNANPPLSGGKGSLKEGGVRVPFVVRGPGIAAGSTTNVRGISWDLVPTFLELAKVDAKDRGKIEGGSLVPVWSGAKDAKVTRPREEVVLHFPHYDLDNGGPASAIYSGTHKLFRSYETGKDSLYDLSSDLAEARDLAASEDEATRKLALELAKKLDEYLKAVGAQMPRANEAWDPAAPAPERRGRREGGGGGQGGGQGRGREGRRGGDAGQGGTSTGGTSTGGTNAGGDAQGGASQDG